MLRPRHTISWTVLGLALVGCSADHPVTGPRQQPPTRPSFQTITPPSGSLTLAPTSNQQGIASTVVVSYAGATLVQVHASGTVHVYAQPAGTDEGLMGAGGVHSPNSGACTGNVYISNGANFIGFCAPQDGPQPPRDPWDTTYVVTGDVNVGWVQGPMTGGTETFTGGPFVVTITPVSVDYNVTASPTTLNYNDTVTVSATVSPSGVNGVNVPWSIDSTTWAPAFGTQASPCAYGNWVTVDASTRTCRKPFTRSGTLTVFATVDGTKQQNAFSVTVTPPQLNVSANPTTTQGPDSVTFTATVTPSTISFSLSSWTWTADTGGVNVGISPYCQYYQKTCKTLISRSGSMKAMATIGEYALSDSVHVTDPPPAFKVTASPRSITSGQSVAFTATVTPAPPNGWHLSSWTWRNDAGGSTGISAGCGWNENPCTRTVSTSGWMIAITVIGGETLKDSAHVSVVPCLTGKDGLDESQIRQDLLQNFQYSQNSQAEGHLLVLYDPSTGQYSTSIIDLGAGSSVCRSFWERPDPGAFPGKQIVAIAHAHIFSQGQSYYCPQDGTFQTAGQGGSKQDWDGFNELQANTAWQAAGWTNFSYWVMDPNNVYVMGPGNIQGSETRRDKTMFAWSGGQCKW